MTLDTHIAAEPCGWRYEKPAHGGGAKTQLLTIGGMSVVGQWRGELGEHYLAWAPLLKRNKALERELLERAKGRKA
jgi:hypothetical protein